MKTIDEFPQKRSCRKPRRGIFVPRRNGTSTVARFFELETRGSLFSASRRWLCRMEEATLLSARESPASPVGARSDGSFQGAKSITAGGLAHDNVDDEAVRSSATPGEWCF